MNGKSLERLLKRSGELLLNNVIPDAEQNGANSVFGYKQMFTNVPPSTITELLEAAATGASVGINGGQVQVPEFVCVNDNDKTPYMRQLVDNCAPELANVAGYVFNLGVIFLCPK